MIEKSKEVGLTKDVGFQIGVRKTYPVSSENVWAFMFSKKGLSIWLGDLAGEFEIKKKFKTSDGIEGLVRVFTPHSHIRLNWKKESWTNMSTLQVRVIPNGKKTTISFHQEKLLDANQRSEMKDHWNNVIKEIEDYLTNT